MQIRLIRMLESTYPVDASGFFTCSDARLERIWDISARTLKLCMEDTFTDCPLYEQTHWVGDARNEALFALDTFGSTDIALRCLRLTAQSLERYPIAGGQVPSGWDMVLPAWSFLWGIAVWDYYFYTGDRAALAELWPAVMRNLRGAEALLDTHGLFSGPFWNMFDWTGVDHCQETVLHNSLLMAGAIEAAQKMAAVVGQAGENAWLADLRARLVSAINRTWDETKAAYPDSLHAGGRPSDSTCQHTSFLALLYDVAGPDLRAAALRNILQPPDGMVRVGSPFAMMYLYEALAKVGRPDEILASIYANYLPMLAEGATTVWEVFPSSGDRPSGFPTRSHTHAWSSAPLHFLPNVVLGIHQTGPGGASYEISPWVGLGLGLPAPAGVTAPAGVAGLEWARGAVCTAHGLLEVAWRKEGSQLVVSVKAPEQVNVQLAQNASTLALETRFERL